MKIRFKKIIILFAIVFLNVLSSSAVKAQELQQKTECLSIIYSYSPTCNSCDKVSSYLEKIEKKKLNVQIVKYNVMDLDNKSLLNSYCQEYTVPDDMSGAVPIIFVRDTYLYDKDQIMKELEDVLLNNALGETLIIDDVKENYKIDENRFATITLLKLITLAFLNGLNPCAISMLIFLIMLIECKEKLVLRMGLTFCIGKFITFFILGTMFYKFLSLINSHLIIKLINIFMLLILIILIILNINDYIAIKNDKLNKIKAQLPEKIRKFNHDFIRKNIEKYVDSTWLYLSSLMVGMIIGSTEFLCSGQIYLSSIVTIIQSESIMFSKAIIYLGIYSAVCILPMILIVLLIDFGKKTFEISKIFVNKIMYIKLSYIVLFTTMAAVLLVQMF